MDFKSYTILRGDNVEVRPKNPHFKHESYNESEWKVFGEEECFLFVAFENFANSRTYLISNPEELPEGVTEVSKGYVNFTWQIFKDNEWIACDEYRAIKSKCTSRYVANYSPKQEREEEKTGTQEEWEQYMKDSYCPTCDGRSFVMGEENSMPDCPTCKGAGELPVQQEKPKEEDLANYLHFREIQSKSFQDREVFVKWLNENYTITKK